MPFIRLKTKKISFWQGRNMTALFVALSIINICHAQVPTYIGTNRIDSAVVVQGDTLYLPFHLAHEKRLTEEDIRNKRENWYVTGLPEFSVDPIRGFSIGGNAFLYNNRTRQDPFFYYTPYRSLYAMSFRVAQNGRIDGALRVDYPFAFNTRWRIRGDIIYANDPNWQYFGIGQNTLNRLSYTDKRTGLRVDNARFEQYFRNLALTRGGRGMAFGEDPNLIYTDRHYNELDYTQFLVGGVAERTFFDGRLRLMLGYELLYIDIVHYDGLTTGEAILTGTGEEGEAVQGMTRITEDHLAKQQGDPDSYWLRHNIGGYGGGRIALFQTGLMWDTRDLEPDPSSGIFAEYAQEISAPWIASQFSFTKHLLHGIFYRRIFPDHLSRTVLTGRAALGYIRGSNIPFTEIFDLWGASEGGGIPVLGGARALRGYRESRFAGMVTGLVNVELRARFYQANILRQHIALYGVPFYDAGTVWDSFADISLDQVRGNPGLGLRIAWNQATILRLDYARSREDGQFFFVFGHTF